MKIKMILLGVFAMLALCSLGAKAAENPPEAPINLKINLLEEPFGIPKEDIRFSWTFVDQDNNEKQTAYRIVIGETYSKIQEGVYLADSGWIEESQSTGVRVQELSGHLEDNSLYYWSVQTRDRDSLEGEFSAPQAFSTSVGDKWESMQGIWGSPNNAFVFLRHSFRLDKEIEKAIVSVTAASPEKSRQYVFDFYMNGNLAGIGPSRLNNGKLYYNTFDVTDYVKQGNNVIGAVCYTEEVRSFLCQVTVFYADGTSEVVANSGRDRTQWKALDGNQIFGNNGTSIGVGNYYYASNQNMNGSLYPYGWSTVSYNAQSWEGAAAAASLNSVGTLSPYPSDNMFRYAQKAKTVKRISDNSYVIDLGKEIVGSLKLTVTFPYQTQVTISYGEELNSDGTVRYQMRTGNVYRETWTMKAGSQVLEDIGMKTYRYIQIDNCPVNLTEDMVQGMAIRQEFSENESSFTSSNNILNDIYGMTKYTIKATNQDLYVDSQGRERGAYEGDVLLNMLSGYSFEDDYSLARHSLDYVSDNPTWPAEYQLFCIMGAWQDYLYTGDVSFLEENYGVLKGKLYDSYFDASIGLVKKPKKELLIDWPHSERDGYDADNSFYNTVFNALCAGAYKDMASIAEIVGKDDDAEFYRSRAEVIKENMIARLYNVDTGRFYDGLTVNGQIVKHCAQHATAYPLAYDIYSSQEMADRMAGSIEEDGFVEMSVYGSFFLLQGLYESNNGDLARQVMSNPNVNEGVKSWAYMMYELNATITTEAWNPEDKANMTFSHPWGSAPASQLVRGMFGIKPLTGGFETFQIKLQPGGVASASITVPTVKGSIIVSYEMLGDGRLKTNVVIPGNTEATLYLPANNPENINLTVNSAAVESTYENGYFLLRLGSGSYEIISESGIFEDTSELWTNAALSYSGYVEGKGWENWVSGGAAVGSAGQQQGLQGIRLKLEADNMDGGIRVDTHMEGYGWLGFKDGAEGNGLPGGDKSVQAVKIELIGQIAEKYDIYYRVHAQTYGWLGWAKNGEEAGTVGLGKRAEALQVKLVPKNFVPGELGGAACIRKTATISYQTHVQSYGWQDWKESGQVSGTSGQAKRLEGIRIILQNTLAYSGSLEYRTHVQTYGWQNWVSSGAVSGTTGQAKRLEAIEIRLTGELAEKYDIYYRVHAQTYGWMGWAKNGDPAGTAEYAKRLEAIEIRLVSKGGAAPGSTVNAFRQPEGIFYQTHVQSYGWQELKDNGQTSGTSGEAKRLEAIQIQLRNLGISGDVSYRTYVQTYGWLEWVKNGQTSGTSGEAKRLEAIQVQLSGNAAEKYDVYYRVHAQTYGWLGWAKNGEIAGTMGQAKRLEAIEIKLIPKGTAVSAGGISFYSSLEEEDAADNTEILDETTESAEESTRESVEETETDTAEGNLDGSSGAGTEESTDDTKESTEEQTESITESGAEESVEDSTGEDNSESSLENTGAINNLG